MRTKITQLQLPVFFFREWKKVVAYTPALDLSTFGKTLTESQKRFNEVVQIFFNETAKMGTTEDVLLECGWEKKRNEFLPPSVISHSTSSFSVALPA